MIQNPAERLTDNIFFWKIKDITLILRNQAILFDFRPIGSVQSYYIFSKM